ncbi:TIGR00266 family protein [Weissella cibaria]|uniref:TIGR00266 family protein n=1 Tax=Weissella cibaria TaxID=137591 RepID=UPI0022E88333|nr:TIGR00266 family protein [Weissella cibaria]
MDYNIEANMQFPLVTYNLLPNETVRIQSGAMVYHTGDTQLKGRLNANGGSGIGKLLRAAGRAMVSGESVFITEVSAGAQGGDLALAPAVPGTIQALEVTPGRNYYLNDSAFLAMDGTVQYSMERQSVGRAILGGQGGLFVMNTSGEGTLLVAAFGSIKEIDLQDAHDFTIDNAHVVAWETSLTYDIHLEGGGLIGSIGTGEGVVNTFNGTGKVLVQSLNLENFANMLKPFMPQPSSN